MTMFRDRTEAGKLLAANLVAQDLRVPVVLALPRGGVPVAFEVAKALAAPLDLIILGPDMKQRRANVMAALQGGLIAPVQMIALAR